MPRPASVAIGGLGSGGVKRCSPGHGVALSWSLWSCWSGVLLRAVKESFFGAKGNGVGACVCVCARGGVTRSGWVSWPTGASELVGLGVGEGKVLLALPGFALLLHWSLLDLAVRLAA